VFLHLASTSRLNLFSYGVSSRLQAALGRLRLSKLQHALGQHTMRSPLFLQLLFNALCLWLCASYRGLERGGASRRADGLGLHGSGASLPDSGRAHTGAIARLAGNWQTFRWGGGPTRAMLIHASRLWSVDVHEWGRARGIRRLQYRGRGLENLREGGRWRFFRLQWGVLLRNTSSLDVAASTAGPGMCFAVAATGGPLARALRSLMLIDLGVRRSHFERHFADPGLGLRQQPRACCGPCR